MPVEVTIVARPPVCDPLPHAQRRKLVVDETRRLRKFAPLIRLGSSSKSEIGIFTPAIKGGTHTSSGAVVLGDSEVAQPAAEEKPPRIGRLAQSLW